jgi:hypothetical protein
MLVTQLSPHGDDLGEPFDRAVPLHNPCRHDGDILRDQSRIEAIVLGQDAAGAGEKAPSGVRTSSRATNGIAAFAVTASCTRRWYANTLPMSTTRPCRRACTSTSTAQFGSEKNSHDLALSLKV